MAHLHTFYDLYRKYEQECNFIVIYVQEAVPSSVNQQNNITARTKACMDMIDIWMQKVNGVKDSLDSNSNSNSLQIVCDNMENETERTFNAFPDRLVILDANKRIAFKGDYGPFGHDLDAIDSYLSKMM
eukprot:65796_1